MTGLEPLPFTDPVSYVSGLVFTSVSLPVIPKSAADLDKLGGTLPSAGGLGLGVGEICAKEQMVSFLHRIAPNEKII